MNSTETKKKKSKQSETAHVSESPSVSMDEVTKFAAMSDSWWDPKGKFKPLHDINPLRVNYILDILCDLYERNRGDSQPLAGLSLLDIGCGGGLLCEPMAILGAEVTGADATAKNIGVAQHHANENGINIRYENTTAELLAERGEQFDIILNMEVIEHVADIGSYMQACSTLLKPGGVMFFSTLNRTPKSFIFAIVGAEYILRWLPKGTHDWQKFVRPSEMRDYLSEASLKMCDLKGMSFNPLKQDWSLNKDLSINYLGYCTKEID